MPVNITKLLCLALICATLLGILSGCQSPSSDIVQPGDSSICAKPPEHLLSAVASDTAAVQLTQSTLQPATSKPVIQQPLSVMPPIPDVEIPNLTADEFFIYDVLLDRFLYISCDPQKTIYPASTTKLYTTYVALQYLSVKDIITVGKEVSLVAYDASVVGFRKGDIVSVESLVYAALLPSGCDASYILAAAAGRIILDNPKASARDAVDAFMAECNHFAHQLGMGDSYFVTPDGYHNSKHRISMEAFAIIGKCSLSNAVIAKAADCTSTTIAYTSAKGKLVTKTLENTNLTLRKDNKYYHHLSIGLKTGTNNEAGYCLLTAYEVDGRQILVGVFGCSSTYSRFKDANKLINAYLPYL